MRLNTSINFQNYIKANINEAIDGLPYSVPLEVLEYDGVFIKGKCLLDNYAHIIIDEIPVMQSPYFHLPIKKNDKGIGLNCSYIFSDLCHDKQIKNNVKSTACLGLIFIPIISNKIKSKDTEATILTDNTRECSLTLKDKSLIYDNGSFVAKINDKDLELDNQSVQLKISGNEIIINGGTLKFENSKIKIEGLAGLLGGAFENVFNAIDLLSTCLKGAATEPSAYASGSPAFKELVKQIVE